MGELICLLSGKGGTGKTTVCAGVSTALASQGEKVLCIDCDVGLRNLDIALGLSDSGSLSFVDVAERGYDLDDAPHHPAYPSLQFLTAPVDRSVSQTDPAAFTKLLNRARQEFTYILLDAPAGVGFGFSMAAKVSDRILLVTGSDPAAIRDARRTAEILELMGKTNVRLIVNRVNKKLIADTELTVDDIMDQAGLPLIGILREDRNVQLAAAYGQPLLNYTRRGAAAACRRIARRLQGHHAPVSL